mgnify:FL=1
MAKIFQRKYENKVFNRAVNIKESRKFLFDRLRREWGEIETTIEKDLRRQELYKTAKETGEVLGLTILGMAAVCRLLIVGAVAPNIFSASGRLGGRRRYFDKNSFRDRIYYYKKHGYVDVRRNSGNNIMEVKLTERGENKVLRKALGDLKVFPQEKWDGIWRIVIFDIPEKNKWAREGLRERLKRMGFYPLQKSTFATPYPCREEIEFLTQLYNIDGYVRLIETKTISLDDDLRDFFGL